ncbi:hypothetical protein Tco_1059466 [Tanacetum coccineum]
MLVGVETLKIFLQKIFYIKEQKEPGKSKEAIYLNSKYHSSLQRRMELGHEHSLSPADCCRRANDCIERVHDFQLGIESYQQKVNLTAPTINFPGIEEHDMFSIIYEPVHGIIYKNSKNRRKRVMRITYGYVQKDLTKDETEYLKLFEKCFEEKIEASKADEKMGDVREWRPPLIRREKIPE